MAKKKIRRAITIHDVARDAGVSVTTVSRVLNNRYDVAPETITKVKQVIDDLGYTSSLAARSMRSRKTDVIGLIIPDVEQPYPIQIMRGVNRAVSELDYDLIVYTSGDYRKHYSADRERKYVSLLSNSVTDGVIVVTPAATSFNTKGPLVAVDPHYEVSGYPAVISTNRDGALSAMEHLIGLGHRRIGFITGRSDLQSAIRRQQGYEEGLRRAGLPIDPELIQPGDFVKETAYGCALNLLKMENRPTAIFAANDQSAFGVFQAANELGLAIPQSLSVVGFDNIPEAEFYSLTTVDQYIIQMGYDATQMLLRLIRGEDLEEEIHRIPTQLVLRNSSQPHDFSEAELL